MLERELVLYRQLQAQGIRIGFVTYGDRGDLQYADQLPGLQILCNRWGWPGPIYEQLLPWLHAGWLRRSNVFKTNQANGADVALKAARLWHKPLIARCGYMWSDQAARGGPERAAEVARARRLEDKVFKAADQVVVTTPALREYIVKNYALSPLKIEIVPNYVLTDLFAPAPDGGNPVPNRLCFVGRLSQLKNPHLLVRACAGLEVELVFVGDGPLRSSVAELAADLKVNLRLLGNLPHRELPQILRQSAIFFIGLTN
ncbi:MAG: glycosyltransferase family 4 protein [Anaerolineales bacterium]|nr:glycosyltransferase family 4 protein [Anaerolineales bacterium]